MNNARAENRIAFVMTDGIEQIEHTEPWAAVLEAGFSADLIADHPGEIQGYIDDINEGDRFRVDKTLDEANPSDYIGIVIPGGVLNADTIRTNKDAQEFVRDFFEKDKFVATICHGAWLLIEAGLVKNKKITSYQSIRTDLVNAGADWIDKALVVDSNLISSRTPDDISEFNREILRHAEAAVSDAK